MPEHSHLRASDEPGKLVIPAWVKQTTAIVISIIVGTVALLTWMDNRYASKADIATLGATLADMQGDLKDIKRVIFERNTP